MHAFRMTLLAVAVLAAASPAAEPTVDTQFLRDYAATRGFLLGRPTKPQPTPDGSAVLFLRSPARSPRNSLYEYDVATKQTRELASPEKLLAGAVENESPEEKARRERQRVSVAGFADFQLDEPGQRVLLQLAGKLYLLDRKSGKSEALATGPGVIDPKFSPDGSKVAYVRAYDLYVYDLAAKRERRLTEGGSAKLTHGLAEFVAQEEMGRFTGYWWSPDSKQVAYEEANAEGVEVWYVADPMEPGKPPQPQFYPRPGKKNVAVRLGVIGIDGGPTTWVEWDRAKYEYLANVVWSKHGPLTLVVQDRRQQAVVVLKADPLAGKTIALLSEADAAWVNLTPKMPKWLDADRFFWISDRDRDAALYLVDSRSSQGSPPVRLSPPQLQVDNLIHVDRTVADSATPVFVGTDSPPHTAIWQGSSVGTGRHSASQTHRSLGPGVTVASYSDDGRTRAVTRTSLTELPRTFVERELATAPVAVTDLPSVAEEPPFKPSITIQRVGDFWTSIVRPRDFDATKKYPVLVDVYGGPHHLHVVAAMRNWLLPQWLADQGFVVVAIDGRGTPHRGRDWERAIYKKFGTVPLDDQVAGLQALGKQFPELDLSRVGIVGWSFGGYMSALAVLKRPDVFHAAVAGAPVCDWLDYDTHYTERYLGLPQDNPEAYREASLLTYANKLTRPLLVVHGTADDNVFFRHTLKLTDALFRAGQPFEVLPLPGLTHMVPDPVVTERLWERIARHFRTHLKP